MSYQNPVELFKQLSEIWSVETFDKSSLIQVELPNRELRWITEFKIDLSNSSLDFKISKDRPDKDVYVAHVMQYIAARIKESMRSDSHRSDIIFEAQIRAHDEMSSFQLKDLEVDPGFIILKQS